MLSIKQFLSIKQIISISKFISIKQLISILLLSATKYTSKYTVWNIIMMLSNHYLQLDHRIYLVNSLTIWSCFHIGGTDNAKTRFIADRIDNKIRPPSILKFIIGDIILHLLPVFYWIHIGWKKKKIILVKHLINVYLMILSYMVLCAKTYNCKEQYGIYPYKRQLFNLITFPLLTGLVFNYSIITNNSNLLSILYVYTWYIKEYFDIYDGSRLLKS